MDDVMIRITGRAGRITLNRPKALNALSYSMCRAIDAALRLWAEDPAVALVVIDAAGEKAFCAGGDIAEIYDTGMRGDYGYGRRFWRDEYRMNARLSAYPKPVVSLMQGFTMGGGVGVGCHGSHRIVGETSRIAMPECGIGLVPDVGGSLLLARAPGRVGAYLGLTAARMGPGDAIFAGFADHFLPQADWPALLADLERTGDVAAIPALPAPLATLASQRPQIDALFAGDTLAEVFAALHADGSAFAAETLQRMAHNAPLAMGCALAMQGLLRGTTDLRAALALEYRFTHRALPQGDLLEGIRAAIIDKDRRPRWHHQPEALPADDVAAMLAPLGPDELTFTEETA